LSDKVTGGKSEVSIEPVVVGAEASKGALQDPANLSGKKTVSFWAKGDGKAYAVALATQSGQGQTPVSKPFVAGPEWQEYSFTISDFETDAHDLTSVAFVHAQDPGKFEFDLDQVKIE
jgi:Complex I intermediate-associated protein 30 (CIA30)